jgi:hypothetical protein
MTIAHGPESDYPGERAPLDPDSPEAITVHEAIARAERAEAQVAAVLALCERDSLYVRVTDVQRVIEATP